MPVNAAPPDTPVSSAMDTVQIEIGVKGSKISKEAQQVRFSSGGWIKHTDRASAVRVVDVAHLLPQIVAGVVLKYANFAQGWQPRLLVLQDDTVRYWKVWGMGIDGWVCIIVCIIACYCMLTTHSLAWRHASMCMICLPSCARLVI